MGIYGAYGAREGALSSAQDRANYWQKVALAGMIGAWLAGLGLVIATN